MARAFLCHEQLLQWPSQAVLFNSYIVSNSLYNDLWPEVNDLLPMAEDLRRVDLVLPPPARLDAGATEGALPQATRKALGQLFAACGLSANFVGGHWTYLLSLHSQGLLLSLQMRIS